MPADRTWAPEVVEQMRLEIEAATQAASEDGRIILRDTVSRLVARRALSVSPLSDALDLIERLIGLGEDKPLEELSADEIDLVVNTARAVAADAAAFVARVREG